LGADFLLGGIPELLLDGAGGVGINLLQGGEVLLQVRHDRLHGNLVNLLLTGLCGLIKLEQHLNVSLVVVAGLDLDGEAGGKHGRNLGCLILGLAAHSGLRVLVEATHKAGIVLLDDGLDQFALVDERITLEHLHPGNRLLERELAIDKIESTLRLNRVIFVGTFGRHCAGFLGIAEHQILLVVLGVKRPALLEEVGKPHPEDAVPKVAGSGSLRLHGGR